MFGWRLPVINLPLTSEAWVFMPNQRWRRKEAFGICLSDLPGAKVGTELQDAARFRGHYRGYGLSTPTYLVSDEVDISFSCSCSMGVVGFVSEGLEVPNRESVPLYGCNGLKAVSAPVRRPFVLLYEVPGRL